MIIYDQTKLKEIVNNYHSNKDFRYKRLPIDAIKTIRTLRLNRKRRRHQYTCQKRRDAKANHAGSHPENLMKIQRNAQKKQDQYHPWNNKYTVHKKQRITVNRFNRGL